MPPAARLTDQTLHDGPHCHAPIHPPAPVPTPVPHPPVPLVIVSAVVPTVIIGGLAAAVVTSQTVQCFLPSCAPGGPGIVTKGSSSVMIGMKPAARVGDLVIWAACVAPIPCPTGKILPPGCPTVIVGG